jgi:hypothetical protein
MEVAVLLSESSKYLNPRVTRMLTWNSLIAYKIVSLKPIRVEESAVGTGGLCGSAFLNYRFEEHVKNRIGQSRFDEMKTKKGKTWQMGLKYFEEFVKRNFNEDEHQEVNVP